MVRDTEIDVNYVDPNEHLVTILILKDCLNVGDDN